MPRTVLPLLLAALAGCTTFQSRDDVLVTSSPPGAHIWVDGTDTGKTTPASLAIGGTFGFDHDIQLTKRGYRPELRRVYQHTEGYTSKWIDGVDQSIVMPSLPLFWTFGDFFLPFGVRAAVVPGELHVRLYREDEPRLGFDALAAKAATAVDVK